MKDCAFVCEIKNKTTVKKIRWRVWLLENRKHLYHDLQFFFSSDSVSKWIKLLIYSIEVSAQIFTRNYFISISSLSCLVTAGPPSWQALKKLVDSFSSSSGRHACCKPHGQTRAVRLGLALTPWGRGRQWTGFLKNRDGPNLVVRGSSREREGAV